MKVKPPQNMSHVNTIEGIGESHAKKLESIGIKTVEELLKAGATPHGRKDLAKQTGFSEHHVLKWVNQADLFRLKGVGRQYAEILQHAGVNSVPELAERNSEHLYVALEKMNQAKHDVHVLPSQSALELWIEEAKQLPRIVSY